MGKCNCMMILNIQFIMFWFSLHCVEETLSHYFSWPFYSSSQSSVLWRHVCITTNRCFAEEAMSLCGPATSFRHRDLMHWYLRVRTMIWWQVMFHLLVASFVRKSSSSGEGMRRSRAFRFGASFTFWRQPPAKKVWPWEYHTMSLQGVVYYF